MKLVKILAATGLLMSAGFANATLESRLGGLAYYDTDLDISWLANANMNGGQTWQKQMTWADNLTVGGVDGWRVAEVGEMFYMRFVENIGPDLLSPKNGQGPFTNISDFYWSNHSFDSVLAYMFNFTSENDFDHITLQIKTLQHLPAWAVHSGDVGEISPIPEPSTYAMLLAGLGLLGVVGRKKSIID